MLSSHVLLYFPLILNESLVYQWEVQQHMSRQHKDFCFRICELMLFLKVQQHMWRPHTVIFLCVSVHVYYFFVVCLFSCVVFAVRPFFLCSVFVVMCCICRAPLYWEVKRTHGKYNTSQQQITIVVVLYQCGLMLYHLALSFFVFSLLNTTTHIIVFHSRTHGVWNIVSGLLAPEMVLQIK